MMVPKASESGTFRVGLRTSPAVKVMLFQASAAYRAPICALHNATSIPKAVAGEGPCPASVNPCGVHAWPKFALTTEALQPINTPIAITARSDPIFIVVKTFCTPLPYLSPFMLVQVRNVMTESATS